jgi:hypothetical protein
VNDGAAKVTRWTIHGERVVDDTRRARWSIAEVELPNGVRFEQYVLRYRLEGDATDTCPSRHSLVSSVEGQPFGCEPISGTQQPSSHPPSS